MSEGILAIVPPISEPPAWAHSTLSSTVHLCLEICSFSSPSFPRAPVGDPGWPQTHGDALCHRLLSAGITLGGSDPSYRSTVDYPLPPHSILPSAHTQ